MGERLLFRLLGVADPAHYLHGRYFRRALNRIDPGGIARCLDAGCGAGDYSFFLARRFPDAEILGVDLDPDRIERNRSNARGMGLTNVTFEVGDLTDLDDFEVFDFVVCVDVLEHILDQQRALENIARALRPNGRGFFHIPTVRERAVPFQSLLQGFLEWGEEEHVAEDVSAETFVSRVEAAGLAVVWHQRTFGYFTGELATSLFALPYEDRTRNRLIQAAMSPLCRLLALLDSLGLESTRYAAAVAIRKPDPDIPAAPTEGT